MEGGAPDRPLADGGVRAEELAAEAARLTYVDPRRGLDLAVAAAAMAPPEGRAAALTVAARCAAYTEDRGMAARLADEGLRSLDQHESTAVQSHEDTAARSHEDTAVRSRLLSLRADASLRLGDVPAAHAHAVEALRLADGLGDTDAAAHALWALGNACFYHGDYLPAQTLFAASRTAFEELGDAVSAGLMEGNHGEALVRRGDVREGVAALVRSLERVRDAAPVCRPRALLMLAEALVTAGDQPRAFALRDEALEEATRLGRGDIVGLAHTARGWSLAASGRHRDARQAFERGLDLARRTTFREAELEALLGLGTTDTRLGALERATAELEEAGALAATSAQRVELARAHRLLADVYETQGAIERAYGHLRASLAVTCQPSYEVVAAPPDDLVERWTTPAEAGRCPRCGARLVAAAARRHEAARGDDAAA